MGTIEFGPSPWPPRKRIEVRIYSRGREGVNFSSGIGQTTRYSLGAAAALGQFPPPRLQPMARPRYGELAMKILALESSDRLGSVALLEAADGRIVHSTEQTTPADQRTARSLLPTTHALLAERGWRPRDIDLVAVTIGPGSFTGLRIGVVAAKTFAYAVGAKLVGVHTLAAMAETVEPRAAKLWTILDAQRQELFVANFAAGPIIEQAEPATSIASIEDWLSQLAAGDQVVGPPLEKLQSQLPAGVVAVDRTQWNPSAAAVGRLGFALFERGIHTSPLEMTPAYYRKSAAEEKADAARGVST